MRDTSPLRDAEFLVPPGASRALDRALRELVPGLGWERARELIRSGKISVNGARALAPASQVDAGDRLSVRMAAPRPNRGDGLALGAREVVWIDPHVVVVAKPAGISTVPFDDGERGALSQRLPHLLATLGHAGRGRGALGVVHRLDKETSGLLVFARSHAAKAGLEGQLRRHSVERRYQALAAGAVSARTFRSRLIADRGDGRRGSTLHPRLGREAVTHVTVRERLDGVTWIECRLETGRTHQIRIHLGEAGHPLLGERVYGAPAVRAASSPAPRLMLHAGVLGFEHPITGEPLRFEREPPEDFLEVLGRARRAAPGERCAGTPPSLRAAHGPGEGEGEGEAVERRSPPRGRRR